MLVVAASGGGQLTNREPVFMPGGIVRLVAYLVFIAAMVLLANVLGVLMDWLLTALGWPASGR
jgi:hypothetical protein